MEARISERLRSLSSVRLIILERIQNALSPLNVIFNFLRLRESTITVHVVIVSCTIIIISSIFIETKSMNLFSFHPLFMIIGFLLFGEAIITYRNKILLDTLSPIMQHQKIHKVRAIHQTLNTLGSSCIFLGLMFIFAYKVEAKKSLFPRSAHAMLGSIFILIVAIQIISGLQKMNSYLKSNISIRRWHSDFGLLVLDLICVTISFGLFSFLTFNLLTIFVWLFLLLTWFLIHLQVKGKFFDDDVKIRIDENESDVLDDGEGFDDFEIIENDV